MQVYVWRHNKKFHSYSMIDEPSVNNNFYLDAVAIVLAETISEALVLLQQQNQGVHAQGNGADPAVSGES